jgi:hypothetical protein
MFIHHVLKNWSGPGRVGTIYSWQYRLNDKNRQWNQYY